MEENYFSGLTGRIVTPNDSDYNTARQGWNHAVQNYPYIINYCLSKTDVSNAIIWSENHQIPLRIRNGGHNYEGYSNGDCVLIIDVSEMIGITQGEGEDSNLLYVQGGVTNAFLYAYVSQRGYPFPGGTCPRVGVGGYVTGGGWGLSCRYLGLGCDSLEEIEMVNYQGEIIQANASSNSDLFWACRGAGGGNFGVITSMTFRLPAPVDNVSLIEIDYLHRDSQEQELFLEIWQNWLQYADIRMTLIARIYQSEEDGEAMLIRGIFYGASEEAQKILIPFLTLPGAVSNIEYLSFSEAVTILGSSYPLFEKFQAVSRFAYKEFSPEEIEQLVDLIKNPPEGSVFTGLSLYALGGKVAETDIDSTAFFYRQARYILWLETVWEEDRYACPNMNWIASRYPVLKTLTTGSYVNFPYYGLLRYKQEYFGDHVKALEEIKLRYDPYNVFTFPQGLLLSKEYSCTPINQEQENTDDISTNIFRNPREFRYVKPS